MKWEAPSLFPRQQVRKLNIQNEFGQRLHCGHKQCARCVVSTRIGHNIAWDFHRSQGFMGKWNANQ